MGKKQNIVIISGLNLNDGNRGTAALGYGSISFLEARKILKKEDALVNIRIYKNVFKRIYHSNITTIIKYNNLIFKHTIVNVFILEVILFKKFGLLLPFTSFGKMCKRLRLVAAINGGDGFSDIYGTETFLSRLPETLLAMKLGIDVIQLPQTLGPFNDASNYLIAKKILLYSSKVYVRDDKFVHELNKIGVEFELTKDLSYYMQPDPWNINIPPNSIGINVSGLAYSNKYQTLKGKFTYYPSLIDAIIQHFQELNCPVFLIPHSYIYGCPETNNDDMVACKLAYEKLACKDNIYFIDKDLTSPQVKYVISKMSFFIGTRMHSNFAAIYTNVPVYGLAYSYKFEGAFKANGIEGQTSNIVDIKQNDITKIITEIDKVYYRSKQK